MHVSCERCECHWRSIRLSHSSWSSLINHRVCGDLWPPVTDGMRATQCTKLDLFLFFFFPLYNFSYGCEFIGPRRWTLPTTVELSANGGALFVFPCSQRILVNTSSCQPVQIQTIRRRERRDGARFIYLLSSRSPAICCFGHLIGTALIGLHNLCVYTGL